MLIYACDYKGSHFFCCGACVHSVVLYAWGCASTSLVKVPHTVDCAAKTGGDLEVPDSSVDGVAFEMWTEPGNDRTHGLILESKHFCHCIFLPQ